MAMLEIKDLYVNYGMIAALKGISFEVNEGEVIALIGANGAGKTTTLHTITGLLHAKSGSITFNGVELTKTPAHKIVEMGIAHVPEGRRIFQKFLHSIHFSSPFCKRMAVALQHFPHMVQLPAACRDACAFVSFIQFRRHCCLSFLSAAIQTLCRNAPTFLQSYSAAVPAPGKTSANPPARYFCPHFLVPAR